MNTEKQAKQFKFWMHVAAIDVGLWADKTFPLSTPQSIVSHMKEELSELDVEVDVNTDSKESLNAIGKEMADIQLLLLHLAHKLEIDLGAHTVDKFEINKKRKWESQANAKGYFKHVD